MNKDISILVLSHKSKNLVTNLIKKFYNKFPIIVVDNSDDLELKRMLNAEYPRVIYFSIENFLKIIPSAKLPLSFFSVLNTDSNGLFSFKASVINNVTTSVSV